MSNTAMEYTVVKPEMVRKDGPPHCWLTIAGSVFSDEVSHSQTSTYLLCFIEVFSLLSQAVLLWARR